MKAEHTPTPYIVHENENTTTKRRWSYRPAIIDGKHVRNVWGGTRYYHIFVRGTRGEKQVADFLTLAVARFLVDAANHYDEDGRIIDVFAHKLRAYEIQKAAKNL
jgi:hypothetical protein